MRLRSKLPSRRNAAILIGLLGLISVGCIKTYNHLASTSLTYNQDIAPIFNDRCVSCHRPGEMGPMPLQTYAEVNAFIQPIAQAVKNKTMPPWHAAPDIGKFANDRRLSKREYNQMLDWIDAGAPEGTGKAPTNAFPSGWQITQPDVIFTIPQSVTIPAQGKLAYQYQVVSTHFTEDKWISAAEIRTGIGSNAHHVIVSVVPPENSASLPEPGTNCHPEGLNTINRVDANNPAANNAALHAKGKYLVGWGVGAQLHGLPTGAAIKIPAYARLVFELHYVANGQAHADATTKLGLTFAKYPVTLAVDTISASHQTFVIPAHATNHKVTSCYRFHQPVAVLDLIPHMHLRGNDFTYALRYPDGQTETLLHVPHFDFEWQTIYRLAKARKIPAGTSLEVIAHYDNSRNNPHNPDPNKTVRFGPETEDEMMIGLAVVMSELNNPNSVKDH